MMTSIAPPPPEPPPPESPEHPGAGNLDWRDPERQLCERSLRYFVRRAWKHIDPAKFQGNWHIDAIADHLEAVSEGQIRRLIIMVPPRHMKSINLAVMWPSWHWGPFNDPSMQWMFTSYAERLAIRDSIKTRRLIKSPWYQHHWGDRFRLTRDQNQKVKFENDKGGYRLATSVEGTNTGEGGRIRVVDDPHNAAEIESDVQRQNVLDWWDGAMSTRSNDPKGGGIVICMQRLDEGDLVGHQLDKAKRYIAAGLTDQAVYDILGRIAARAGLRAVTGRDLRRAYVFSLIRAGRDLREVQYLTGHASWVTTTSYRELANEQTSGGYDIDHLPYSPAKGAR